MAKFDAVFVGLTILDVAGRAMSEIPEGGNCHFIEEIKINPAGTASGANMNAAKMGIKTAAVACLGEDSEGDFILDTYKRMNIDCSMISKTTATKTSATILPIRPNGDRPAWHARGASDYLFVTEDQFDAVCDAHFLHHGGTGLLNKMDTGQSAKLLAHAKNKGLTTSFDLIAPNDETVNLLEDTLPHVDYFMPSIEEAEFMSGLQGVEKNAEFYMNMGADACILKCGAEGSYIKTKTDEFRIPAYKIDVQDTTGCGDSYCGAFIAGLSLGYDLKKSCQLATAVSGLVASGLGSDAGVVDLATTLAFMENNQ